MTITQMQYFQAVCKYENFTRAAEDQHISQPAMSAAMKDLEAECGVPLFKKTRNSLSITDAGWALLEEIQVNLRQYDHLMHAIKDLSLSRKYVRVGLSTFSGNLVYPSILRAFHARYPDIQIISTETSTSKQFELLDQGKLDVLFTGRRFASEEERVAFDQIYHTWSLAKTYFSFCVCKEHPLAAQKEVTYEQIAQVPLVMMTDRYSQTRDLKATMTELGLEYQIIHYTDQMYTIERFVEQNAAGGFLPTSVAQRNPNIAALSYPFFPGQVNLYWRKDQLLFSSTKAFIDLVKELYPKK